MTREQTVVSAVRNELKPCKSCGKAKWFHMLPLRKRQELDPRARHHAFQHELGAEEIKTKGGKATV